MTRLARYSVELFADLARQTGQETGYQTTGSMTVALHAERRTETPLRWQTPLVCTAN